MASSERVEALRAPLASIPDPLRLPGPPLRAAGATRAITIRPPGSKSLTNRALVLAALAEGRSTLAGALTDAVDARRMIDALRALGVGVEEPAPGTLVVDGVAGAFPRGGEINLENAGTATRFLTGVACLAKEPVVIDGNTRMRERPIGELVGLLRRLGVGVAELGEPGFVPLRIKPGRPTGGALDVPTTLSSQYVSALLMLAPWTERGIDLTFTGAPTSPSYVDMTLGLLERLGAQDVRRRGEPLRRAGVGPGGLRGFELPIEPDASGATYFWAAAAMTPGLTVSVDGLESSLQGDARFVDLLAQMGARVAHAEGATRVEGLIEPRAVEADLSLMPDAAMTLAAAAAVAEGATVLHGLRTLRVKETDRIHALQVELAKVGVSVETFERDGDEGVVIEPPRGGLGEGEVAFDTYDDHRMAMSLALLALRRPGVAIRDPGCVSKTYPGYWADFARFWTP